MIRLFAILFLVLAVFGARAAERISLSITVSNLPVTGDALGFSAPATKLITWSNTTSSTFVSTNLTMAGCATNLFLQMAAYAPWTPRPALQWVNDTNFLVIAECGAVITVTNSGTWAVLSLDTNDCAALIDVRVPVASEKSAGVRNYIASELVKAVNTYATNVFDGIRLTNLTGLNGTVNRLTNGNYVTATNNGGLSSGVIISNVIQLHGTNHLLYGGTVEASILTNNVITNVAVLHGTLLGLTNGVLTANRITNGVGLNATVYWLTNGVWTNATFDVPKMTNATVYGGFSSPGYMADGTLAATSEQFGSGALATNTSALAVGSAALAAGEFSTAIGRSTLATNYNSLAIGPSAEARGRSSIAIGGEAISELTNTIAIGTGAYAGHHNSVAVGVNATTTAAGQMMLGSADVSQVATFGRIEAGSYTNSMHTGSNAFRGSVGWEEVSISTLANGNNIAAPATNKFMRLVASGPTAAFALCGIQGGWNGRELVIWNDTGQAMTMAHESGVDPTPANRIYSTSQGDLACGTNAVVWLMYSAAKSRWLITATTLTNNPSLANDSVTDGILRNSAAVSVIGRSVNSAGDPADILFGGNGRVLGRSNDIVSAQQLALTNFWFSNVDFNAVSNGQVIAYHAASGKFTNMTVKDTYTVSFWQGISALASPADSTTYFVGAAQVAAIGTTYAATAVQVPHAGTVVGVTISVTCVAGTAEDVAHYVRVNDTTDSAVVNIDYDATYKTGYSGSLSVPVAAGDTLALKIVTPAWATNPTGLRVWATVTIERTQVP